MVGRVWPRQDHHGRPLNSIVRRHLAQLDTARTSPIITALLATSVALGLLLIVGAVAIGPQIIYVGGSIAAIAGALFAAGYLIASHHPWKLKSIGIVAFLVNGAIFAWLYVAFIQTYA
jgi:membrane-associated protease RseP (regulator of RpoE activity)